MQTIIAAPQVVLTSTVVAKITQDPVFFADLAILAEDPSFFAQLKSLVQTYQTQLKVAGARECFGETLLSAPSTDKRVAGLLSLHRHKSLWYGSADWVPGEFQELDNQGFVHCHKGSCDHQGRPSRELYLSTAGIKLADKLVELHAPVTA